MENGKHRSCIFMQYIIKRRHVLKLRNVLSYLYQLKESSMARAPHRLRPRKVRACNSVKLPLGNGRSRVLSTCINIIKEDIYSQSHMDWCLILNCRSLYYLSTSMFYYNAWLWWILFFNFPIIPIGMALFSFFQFPNTIETLSVLYTLKICPHWPKIIGYREKNTIV